jgi:SRSO17 transposase
VAFVQGLMSQLPRKNCWTLAEHGGEASPAGLQHLMSRACWNHDGIRDDVPDYVVAGLGDQNAVLVVDETGDLKKGSHTVGVERQHTGTAARVENAQVAVCLAHATDTGHAFIDRKLCLPRSWADDPERRAAAGVPVEVEFATKPALAITMVCRALDAGVAAGWVSGDEVCGGSWPTTAASHPLQCRWACWSPWPGGDGPSKKAFQTGKGLCGLDEHQVRRGSPGTAGPSCPCTPTHSSPFSPPPNDQTV